MMLTPKERKLIIDHLYIARLEAKRQINRSNWCSLDYEDMKSIGYLTITELVVKGKHKNKNALNAFFSRCIRYDLIHALGRNNRYLFTEDCPDITDVAGTKEQDELCCTKEKEALIFLPLEDQAIWKHKYTDGMTCDKLSKKYNMTRSAMYSRLNKIKNKLKKK